MNFTTNKQLRVFDLVASKDFSTGAANVAKERDFNRIESDVLGPNALEDAYGKFESEIAPTLKKVGGGASPSHDDITDILNLMAVIAVRNPRHRENFEKFQDNVYHGMLEMMSSTEDRWNSQIAKAKAAGYMQGVEDVPYEVIREKIKNRDFRFLTSTHEHARIELKVNDDVLQALGARTWQILQADKSSGGFITCDHPVVLVYNTSPRRPTPIGFGLRETSVYFTISSRIALRGQFDGPSNTISADVFTVGGINRMVVNAAKRQVYASDDSFKLFDLNGFHQINKFYGRAEKT